MPEHIDTLDEENESLEAALGSPPVEYFTEFEGQEFYIRYRYSLIKLARDYESCAAQYLAFRTDGDGHGATRKQKSI